MRGALLALALCAALGAAPARARAAVPVPALTGPVVDRAGALDPVSTGRLSALARRAWRGGEGPQLQVLVVRSLEGEPIEAFALRIAEAWKLGAKERDDGVLIVVAVDDRQVRIEVGNGVEGALPDARCARIVRDVLAPAFRAGRYGAGLVRAADEILAALGAAPAGSRAPAPTAPAAGLAGPPRERSAADGDWFGKTFAAALVSLLVLAALNFFFGRGRRREPDTSPFWDSGSSGSSSSDSTSSDSGGSWSGGGGDFSGGGASGHW